MEEPQLTVPDRDLIAPPTQDVPRTLDRFLAYLIDSLVAAAACAPALGAMVAGGDVEFRKVPDSIFIRFPIPILTAIVFSFAAYIGFFRIWLVVRNGWTLGKRAMGLRIIDASTGGRVTALVAVKREAASLAGGMIFSSINVFWAFFDRQRRQGADLLAGTRVIQPGAGGRSAAQQRLTLGVILIMIFCLPAYIRRGLDPLAGFEGFRWDSAEKTLIYEIKTARPNASTSVSTAAPPMDLAAHRTEGSSPKRDTGVVRASEVRISN